MLYEELPFMLEQEALSDALADERKTLLELELANDEALQEPKEGKRKKRLKRELVREALTRLEESARSENEFREVVQFWDRLEENEVRRVGNHETLRGDIPLEWGMAEDGHFFPASSGLLRQIQKGDFIETIFYCPYEIHELVEDADISKLLRRMKEDHKEILFYLAVRRYSAARIAAVRGQTDRNIRKVRDTLLKGLRKKLRKRLAEKDKQGLSLTVAQRAFLQKTEKPPLDSAKDNL